MSEARAQERRPGRRLLRAALAASPPFVLLIAAVLLHDLGWIPRHHKVAYEKTLIANLLLYWAAAALVLAALRGRRELAGWLRTQRGSLVALTISSVLSLVGLEVALRLLRPPPPAPHVGTVPSPELHHRNPPDARGLGMGGHPVVTNEDGFRSAPSREDFLRHPVRIAVLGDSFAYGLGVAGEDAFPAVLERALEEQLGEGRVAVLNTGAISYSPFIERLVLRRLVAPYRPTLTLLVLDANDVGDDHQYAKENVSGDPREPRFDVPPAPSTGPGACDRLALCHQLTPLWRRLAIPWETLGKLFPGLSRRYDYYDFEVEVGGVVESDRFFILRHPLEDTRPFFEATLGYVREAAAEARALGSAFVLVVAPRYFHWNDAECPENWESFRYGVDEPHEDAYLDFFAEVTERVDFPVFQLLPAFEASDDFPLVFRHDPHWNEAGHRLVGEALASYLLESGLLESGSSLGVTDGGDL